MELDLDSKQVFRKFFIGLLNSRVASVYPLFINDPVWKYVREVNLEFANLYIGVNFMLVFCYFFLGSFSLHLWDEISK